MTDIGIVGSLNGTSTVKNRRKESYVSKDDIDSYLLNPIVALCKPLQLHDGRWCVPHGDSMTGKTGALLQAMVDVSLEKPIFNHFEIEPSFFNGKPPNLVFISFEMHSRVIWHKVQRMYQYYGVDFFHNGRPRINIAGNDRQWIHELKFVKVFGGERQITQDSKCLDRWCETLEGVHFGGVDSFSAANSNWPENDREIGNQLLILQKASDKTGCVGAILHHDTKNAETFRGSTSIRANIGSQYHIQRESGSNLAKWTRRKAHYYYDDSEDMSWHNILITDPSYPNGSGPMNIRVATKEEVSTATGRTDLAARITAYLESVGPDTWVNITKIRDSVTGNSSEIGEMCYKLSTGDDSVLEYESSGRSKMYRLKAKRMPLSKQW